MKKLLTLILVLCSQISFGALNAYFAYALFDQPSGSPYIETYLNVSGPTAVLVKNSNGLYQGKIEIQWIYKKGDSIVHFDKYNLLGPEQESSLASGTDFIDQQRVPLDVGEYQVELRIQDKNSDQPAFTAKQKIIVNFPKDKVSISSIEMLESFSPSSSKGKFTKSSYDVVPMVTSFYPGEIKSLKFYAEIYRAKEFLKSDYLVRYSITNSNNSRMLSEFASIKKQSPEEVNVLLAEMSIDALPTGNYYLTVEVLNQQNKLVAYQQTFFQRSNNADRLSNEDLETVSLENTFVSGMNDPAALKNYISYLYPISAQVEGRMAENIISRNNVEQMQRYLYSFWVKRNPEGPEAAWIAYKAEVDKVNSAYSSQNKKGYETDRGRVYLQYGPPNSITAEDMNANARPYEIWHYYQLGYQTNRKFVFYSLGNSANDYQLIHSDAQGELQDAAWELKLHDRTQQFGSDMDQENSIDTYGNKTKDNFRNPK